MKSDQIKAWLRWLEKPKGAVMGGSNGPINLQGA